MMPIAPLMIEHRLIERLIRCLSVESKRIQAGGKADVLFIDDAVDFIRTYADRCHHGKEEDILFRDLGRKELAAEHEKVMKELIDEHVLARSKVRALVDARKKFTRGSRKAAKDIGRLLGELAEFYPRHIEKEDRHFFVPVMSYFSKAEQGKMFEEFWQFDRSLIHEKYRNIVERLEAELK
jgi:hemerythrin-like domain-containing protein